MSVRYTRETILEMLKENDTYGYWKIPINEFKDKDDFTAICLRCNETFYHKKRIREILGGTIVACKRCSIQIANQKQREAYKEKLKASPNFGCIQVINIDTDFNGIQDCTVKCTKCNTIHKHFNISFGFKEDYQSCPFCRSVKRYLNQIWITKDKITCKCVKIRENTYFVLKDVATGNLREVTLSTMTRGIENLVFYNKSINKAEDKIGEEIISIEGIPLKIVGVTRNKNNKVKSYKLQRVGTDEIIERSATSLSSINYNYTKPNELLVNEEYITSGGFCVKLLENKGNYSKVLFKDGFTKAKNAHFTRGTSFIHPNMNSKYYGKYFNYILEGIAFRLDDPKDVYYNCKKDGSDEYEILRPCDIEEKGWDTHNGYTIYGKVLDLSTEDSIYYKCQKEGSDKIEVLRLCDML